MRLRAATSSDAPALARILGDWVRESGWMPILHSREEDLGFLRMLIESTEVTVAEEGSVTLGFLSSEGEEIRALYLAPPARRQGTGRALLDEAKARNSQLRLWVFQANPRAAAFYRREGFRVEFQTDGLLNEERLPDIRMIWEAMT